jgi:DNA-directed RNA polymerase subunit alpha
LTVGNALRRVLLSALEGYAITSVRIEGGSWVYYCRSCWRCYRNYPNLKQVRFKRQIEDMIMNQLLSVSGKDQLTAGDFQNLFQVSKFWIQNLLSVI